MEKILVVDDEQGLRDVLSIMLKRAGYAVTVASDGDEAIAQVQKEIFDLVITDLKMPRVGGLEVLKAVKAASPDTVVLMITAFASADSAVEAMKHGAYDYLTTPFQVDDYPQRDRAAPIIDGEYAPEAGAGQPVVVLSDHRSERGDAEGL